MSTQRQTAASSGSVAAQGTDHDQQRELEQRAASASHRIARIGIPRQELARLAGIDRGTLSRALKADPRTLANDARTWVRIERELDKLEEEIGFDEPALTPAHPSRGDDELVTSTVEYGGATITMSGRADAVAEAIRRVLSEQG